MGAKKDNLKSVAEMINFAAYKVAKLNPAYSIEDLRGQGWLVYYETIKDSIDWNNNPTAYITSGVYYRLLNYVRKDNKMRWNPEERAFDAVQYVTWDEHSHVHPAVQDVETYNTLAKKFGPTIFMIFLLNMEGVTFEEISSIIAEHGVVLNARSVSKEYQKMERYIKRMLRKRSVE